MSVAAGIPRGSIMFTQSSGSHGLENDEFGFPISKSDPQDLGERNANSADEVIEEMGLVLVVILGIVVAVNLVLGSLHIG